MNTTYWPNEFDDFMNNETTINENNSMNTNPKTFDELEEFFVGLIEGHREERDFYFIINDGEYNITQNSKYVILRKTNKPLKNLTLTSEYKYDWDAKKRIKDFFYELKILA